MKNKLLIILLGLIPLSIFTQNPFEDIGIKVKVLTLSDGKYQEFFPNDTLRRVGSVMFNAITGKIEYFVSEEQLRSEATAKPYLVSRWFSRDPLAAKYPSMSPYNAMGNNPIINLDQNGDSIYDFRNKGSRNVAIVLLSKEDVENGLQNQWKGGIGSLGWDFVVTDDEAEAADWLQKNYSQSSIQNMAVRVHSVAYKKDGQQYFGIMGNEDPINGNYLRRDDIIDGDADTPREAKIFNSFTTFGSFVENGGVLCLAACSFATKNVADDNRDEPSIDKEKITKVLPNLFDNENINLYINSNQSRMFNALSNPSSNPGVTYEAWNDVMWILMNNSGIQSYGNDLKVTEKGFEEVSTEEKTKF